ncbi:hypothetical protein C6503_25020 [Candidatus Poribacteria bacterium]|nr:MAG: hypothetical protein C6503_25020 [Candidatus Poribacteria bacterium]
MKKPIFLILIGIGVLILVGGIVFVVPWFGRMMEEMDQIHAQQEEHRRALEASAREPLTADQETLLSQLLEAAAETDASQSSNDLETVLSSEPYLTYLKTQEEQDYADFPAYIDAMPTDTMKTVAIARIKAMLGEDKTDEELIIWLNYYFVVREWGTTVENPLDNIKELHELQQTHLIEPLMENGSELSSFSIAIVQLSTSPTSITEDNNVFQEVWRERLETHGEPEGLLRCAVASPVEFALMRSFFADMAAFQAWILKPPEPEAQNSEK